MSHSHYQNELLELMARKALLQILSDIRKSNLLLVSTYHLKSLEVKHTMELSSTLGKKSCVAKQIKTVQPKAFETHCHGHSLNLAIKVTTQECKLLMTPKGQWEKSASL